MASKEQLRKIAIYCDSYEARENEGLKNLSQKTDKNFESCENCIHFTDDRRCELDLIDKVLSSLAMEQDLKS